MNTIQQKVIKHNKPKCKINKTIKPRQLNITKSNKIKQPAKSNYDIFFKLAAGPKEL